MGADLTCFIVKGPYKITEDSQKKAAQALLELACKQRADNQYCCENCGETWEKKPDDPNDLECPGCGNKHDTDMDVMTLADAEDVIREFCANWPPSDFRDCNYRTDPDDGTQILVVAGDMSWGDEPDGAGYRYMKRIVYSGVAEILGIR
jgi:DNA-directed RNA polymerase subunit RPC12/RpoP